MKVGAPKPPHSTRDANPFFFGDQFPFSEVAERLYLVDFNLVYIVYVGETGIWYSTYPVIL